MSTKYINNSLYDKKFYRDITIYKLKSNPIASIGIIAMGFILFVSSKTLLTDSTNSKAWFGLIIGLIIIPIATFLIPLIVYTMGYKTLIKDEHFKDLVYTTEISTNSIHCKDTRGQSFFLQYKDIKILDNQKRMIVIGTDYNHLVYLKKTGFDNCDPNEVEKFIRQRTLLENPDSPIGKYRS